MGDVSTDLQVTDYWLNYRIASNTVKVWVKTDNGGAWMLVNEVSPETASFLRDLLASGNKVYFIKGVSLHSKDVAVSS